MKLLLIDVGNTRLKWGLEDAGNFTLGESVPSSEAGVAELFDSVLADFIPERVALANVAAPALTHQIAVRANQQWQLDIEEYASVHEACGLRNSYVEPTKLGIDRWAAMIAAWHKIKAPVCVISSGTALTIDLVDQAGKHLGGLIVPGYRLMQQALLDKGPRLPDAIHAELTAGAFQFGKNTLDCLAQGGRLALTALVERAVAEACADLGREPAIMLTGGDAQMLQADLNIQTIYEPGLVLHGLALLAHNRTAVESA